MKQVLHRLYEHDMLSSSEAFAMIAGIADGKLNDHQVSSLLTVYLLRPPALQELAGFRDALLSLCHPVDLPADGVTDIVGTGGDGKDTFNISTLSALVVAGVGIKVVKHGNYAAGSVSGSSNVLEYLFSSCPSFPSGAVTSGACT
jgi:anthranilate phosphoribosyltransferase